MKTPRLYDGLRALAVALDRHGISSIVVDPADPEKILAASFDGRASAIASAPYRMFEAIGVADRLAGKGCPIQGIRVSDGLAPGKLDFEPGGDETALGHMFENRILRTALFEAAQAAPRVDLRMKTRAVAVERGEHGVVARLDSGAEVRAPLLIAAEGRNSPTREAAGLKVARWTYDHAAMVTTIGHEHSHENIAYEIFYPEGPFAILPLVDHADGHRSAIVWTVKAGHAAGMLALSERGYPVSVGGGSLSPTLPAAVRKRLQKLACQGPVTGGVQIKWSHYWRRHLDLELAGDVNLEIFVINYLFASPDTAPWDYWLQCVRGNGRAKLPVSEFCRSVLLQLGLPESECSVLHHGYSREIPQVEPPARRDSAGRRP